MKPQVQIIYSLLVGLSTVLCGQASAAVDNETTAKIAFLEEVREQVLEKRWLGLLDLADKGHRKTQLTDLGQSHAQYIAELLGLNFQDNRISPDRGPIEEKDLAQIQKLRWETVSLPDREGWIEVTGSVTLENGETLKVQLFMVSRNGAYRLIGAVG